MERKKLSLSEKRNIQIHMLLEVDSFCRKYNLKYSLAYGTLLGAVRHKGFIPWDDDMDIMMPISDLLIFKKTFSSDTINYTDVDTDKNYSFAFPRLVHNKTFSNYYGIDKGTGVFIDLYPVLGLPDSQNEIKKFFLKGNILLNIRLWFMRIRKFSTKYFSIYRIPFFNFIQKFYRNFIYKYSYKTKGPFFTYGGELILKNVYYWDLFEELIDLEFENHNFYAIKKYHFFLKQKYGDYLTLPPENERIAYHEGPFYWK